MSYIDYLAYTGNTTFYDRFDGDLTSEHRIKCIINGCLINIMFSIRTIKEFPEEIKICQAAVSKFLTCGYVNDYLIEKYPPFYLWHKRFCDYDIYKMLMEKHPKLNYTVAKAAIMQRYNDLYFSFDFQPEEELIMTASLTENTEIYEDQINKAKKLGYCYSYLDYDNYCIKEEPGIEEIPDIEPKFNPFYVYVESGSKMEDVEYAVVNLVEEFKYLQMVYDMSKI